MQTLVVPRGQLRQTSIYLAPINDYQGTVTLGCGNLPANITCRFDPASITLKTDNFVPTTHNGTLTISTGVPLASTAQLAGRGRRLEEAATFWLPTICLALAMGAGRRRSRMRLGVWYALLLSAILLGSGACGAGSSKGGGGLPAAGTTTISIQASDPSQSVSHTLQLTVVIQ